MFPREPWFRAPIHTQHPMQVSAVFSWGDLAALGRNQTCKPRLIIWCDWCCDRIVYRKALGSMGEGASSLAWEETSGLLTEEMEKSRQVVPRRERLA